MKKLFFVIQSLFTYPLLALPAFAQTGGTPVSGTTSVNPCDAAATGIAGILCGLGGANTATTLRNVVLFFIILAVIIALLYLLYGGIKWITSRGEKTEVEAARGHIMAAITGLIIVFLAIFILSIILSLFGIGFDKLVIPTISGK